MNIPRPAVQIIYNLIVDIRERERDSVSKYAFVERRDDHINIAPSQHTKISNITHRRG